MHRFPLRPLLLALLAATPAWAQGLQPLAWADAGFGRLDGSLPASVSAVCRFYSGLSTTPPIEASAQGACPNLSTGGTSNQVFFAPASDGHFELTSNAGRLTATLVSEADGSTWRLGVRDLDFVLDQIPDIGETAPISRLGYTRIDLRLWGSASFDVPKRRSVGAAHVALRPGMHLPPLNPVDVQSALLGSFPGISLAPVASYPPGDHVRLFASEPLFVRVIAKALADADRIVTEISITAETPCGEGGAEDCVVSLELLEPGQGGGS